MNRSGGPDLLVRARAVLLDALDALAAHRHAVVVIGAQAIYLHTGRVAVALAEATKDSDLASSLLRLRDDALAGPVTRSAIGWLDRLFAAGPDALGSRMAGRAEEGVGDPEVVAASVAALAQDLVEAL